MRERMQNLLMELPFERVMEIAAAEEITVHYDAKRGDFYTKYCMPNPNEAPTFTETTLPNQKNIKLAVIAAIISKLRSE